MKSDKLKQNSNREKKKNPAELMKWVLAQTLQPQIKPKWIEQCDIDYATID